MAALKPGVPIKPIVKESDVQEILRDVYGLKCTTVKELNGYDDKNYHVKVRIKYDNEFIEHICESGYTLKIVNTLDSENEAFFEAQNEVVIFLGNKGICCPQPVQTKSGQKYATKILASGKHIVRLLTFVDGLILHQVPPSNEIFFQAGRFAAQLDEALKGFYHSGYDNRNSIWILDSLPQLTEFLFAIKDDSMKTIVEEVIREFTKRVTPVCKSFESGMIHGDFNEQNILVEKKDNKWVVKGILDFGDSHVSYYIYELAIAMAYMIIQGKNLDVGGYVLKGYDSVKKIPTEEFKLLKVLIAGRICQSVVMAAYSILHDPDNEYILTTSRVGWGILTQLWVEPEDKLLERWKSVMDGRK